MTHGYKIFNQDSTYYLTLQIVEWVDIFSREVYKEIIIDSLKYCQKEKGLEIYAYVIMSNHVHLVVKSKTGKLSETIRDFKRHTSKAIIKEINEISESRRQWMLNIFEFAASKHKRNKKYQVWTHENHPEVVESNMFIIQKINYIHNNPVKAGLVYESCDYKYSSARNYAEMESVLDVERLSL